MMKTILVLGFCVGLTLPSFSQTEKGKILTGGQMSFSSKTFRTEGNFSFFRSYFEFSPKLGLFAVNNWVLGTSFPITSLNVRKDGLKTTSTSVAFYPFSRYYFGKRNVKPFIYGECGWGTETIIIKSLTGDPVEDISTGNTVGWGLGAGMAFFLKEEVAIDFGLGYSADSNRSNNLKQDANGLAMELGISLLF